MYSIEMFYWNLALLVTASHNKFWNQIIFPDSMQKLTWYSKINPTAITLIILAE